MQDWYYDSVPACAAAMALVPAGPRPKFSRETIETEAIEAIGINQRGQESLKSKTAGVMSPDPFDCLRSLIVLRSSSEPELDSSVAIPVLGTISAGTPLFAPENQLGEVFVEAATVRSGRHFALKVSGNSMIDAGINSGDKVVVRQQQLAEHRDIVVALLNDESTVKRLYHRQGEIMLLPENKRLKPINVAPEDDFRIIGKVIEVLHHGSISKAE